MLKIYIYWHKCWCHRCGTDGQQVKIVLLSFWSVNRWVSQLCDQAIRLPNRTLPAKKKTPWHIFWAAVFSNRQPHSELIFDSLANNRFCEARSARLVFIDFSDYYYTLVYGLSSLYISISFKNCIEQIKYIHPHICSVVQTAHIKELLQCIEIRKRIEGWPSVVNKNKKGHCGACFFVSNQCQLAVQRHLYDAFRPKTPEIHWNSKWICVILFNSWTKCVNYVADLPSYWLFVSNVHLSSSPSYGCVMIV